MRRQPARRSASWRDGRLSSLSILRRAETEQPTHSASSTRVNLKAVRRRRNHTPKESVDSTITSPDSYGPRKKQTAAYTVLNHIEAVTRLAFLPVGFCSTFWGSFWGTECPQLPDIIAHYVSVLNRTNVVSVMG